MQVRKDMAFGETHKWKTREGLFQREKATCGMEQGCYADGGFWPYQKTRSRTRLLPEGRFATILKKEAARREETCLKTLAQG